MLDVNMDLIGTDWNGSLREFGLGLHCAAMNS